MAEPGKPAALARRALVVAPNPFARSAIIHWNLAHESDVSLKVFDATGRAVRTLVHGAVRAGSHTTLWNGADDCGRELAHGIYFVRLETAGNTVKVKTVLTR
jgi:flagellar hook assembly protein FlgD